MSLELAFRSRDAVAGAGALPPPFACSYTNGGLGAAWVQVGGVLEIATTPQLDQTLDASTARLVMSDLPELAFVDSGGLHAIVSAGGAARQAGRRLTFVRVPSSSHFRECGSPRTAYLSINRHDPVDRGAPRGSTT
jgi:anti-anti-sigma regulatory factor